MNTMDMRGQISMVLAMRYVIAVAEKVAWPQIAPAKAKAKVAKDSMARVSMGPKEAEKDGKQKVDGRRRAARERQGQEKDTKEKGFKARVSTAERSGTKLGTVGVQCLCRPRKNSQKRGPKKSEGDSHSGTSFHQDQHSESFQCI